MATLFVVLAAPVAAKILSDQEACDLSGECSGRVTLEYGDLAGGELRMTETLNRPDVISRVSQYMNGIEKNHCSQWKSAWWSATEFTEELLIKQGNKEALAHGFHKRGVVCYPQPASYDVRAFDYSVSLHDANQYCSYLRNVRLPIEAAGGRIPEKAKYLRLSQGAWKFCENVFSFAERSKLQNFLDPVTVFPELVRLGKELRTLGRYVLPWMDLVHPSTPLKGKTAFATDVVTRLESLKGLEDESYINQTTLGWYESLFIPVSLLVPDNVKVTQLKGGSIHLIRGQSRFEESLEDIHWRKAFELLTFVIHQNLQDVTSIRAPYFYGYVQPDTAIKFARASGFYDLTSLAGNFSHGTLSHMLQLLHLKQFGLNEGKLAKMDSTCWNVLLDSTSSHHWGWGAGMHLFSDKLSTTDKRMAFHDIPSLSAPEVWQRLLTQKVLSRLIRSTDKYASEQEKRHFKEDWLKTDRSLADVADDVEVLENTVLAEHLSHWKLMFKYAPWLKLAGNVHGNEMYFDRQLISAPVEHELIERFRRHGYTVEKSDRSYLFIPPDFDAGWYEIWPFVRDFSPRDTRSE